MTIKELKEVLDTLPDETKVAVVYYACGSEQKVSLEKRDLRLEYPGLVIDASYN